MATGGFEMASQTAKPDTINPGAAAPAAVVTTVEIPDTGQQFVILVVCIALRVVPMVQHLIVVVTVGYLVSETTKQFVLGLHESHVLTAASSLQKELGPSYWARELGSRPVARVRPQRRRFRWVQVL